MWGWVKKLLGGDAPASAAAPPAAPAAKKQAKRPATAASAASKAKKGGAVAAAAGRQPLATRGSSEGSSSRPRREPQPPQPPPPPQQQPSSPAAAGAGKPAASKGPAELPPPGQKKKKERTQGGAASRKSEGPAVIRYRGISQWRDTKKWRAFIYDPKTKTQHRLGGAYGTAGEAAKAYDKAALELGRPANSLNFLPDGSLNPLRFLRTACHVQQQQQEEEDSGDEGAGSPSYQAGARMFKGVDRDPNKKSKPYVARIRIGGEKLRLGYYRTPEEAARAVDEVAKRDPNRPLNFLPDGSINPNRFTVYNGR